MKALRITLAILVGALGAWIVGWTLVLNARFSVIVDDLSVGPSIMGYLTAPAALQLGIGTVVVLSLCWLIMKVKPSWLSIVIFIFSGIIYAQHVYFLQFSALSLVDMIVDGLEVSGEQEDSADSTIAEPAGP